MFEKASRKKLRFETSRGNISAEDLWDLPFTSFNGDSLDSLARKISKAIRENETDSFVEEVSAKDSILELKLEILKRVIAVRLAERAAAEKEVETKAKKEKIIAVIAEKEDDSLKGKSVASLTKMLEDL